MVVERPNLLELNRQKKREAVTKVMCSPLLQNEKEESLVLLKRVLG
jgi:hypothetical protein